GAALGWRLGLLDGVSDGTVSSLLGLSRDEDLGEAEREEPELLALITPELSSTVPRRLNKMSAESGGVLWQGRGNTLSPQPCVEWPMIDQVAWATQRFGHASIPEDCSRFPRE